MFSELLKCYESMKKAYNNSQNNNYLEKLYKKFYVDYVCDYSITTKMSESEILYNYIKVGANDKNSLLYDEYSNLLSFASGIDDLEIILDSRLLNDKQSDFFHYECSYDIAKCKYGTFCLTSCGELSCVYTDENGEETRNYDDIVRYYVRNDEELKNAIESGRLDFSLNNWFEIHFVDNNEDYLEWFDYTDNVYGCISEGLKAFLDLIDYEELIEELRKGGR